MKKCYADETLNVSKDPFEKPDELSIILDCDEYNDKANLSKKGKIDDPEIDF